MSSCPVKCVCLTEEMAVCVDGCPGGVFGEGHVCWSEYDGDSDGVIGVDV